ncbi:hypothetical protein [Methanobacterium formicicum]|uniref:Uncharacterized protein n=1 Tax=Methanobacterium formicicum (strain DSM 3637 / PP1) TaxID=1204725 RepID=K2RRR4_METFP|nr:hypothetical protein [Methanobacterium formicicum]EKF85425.1 hypothetical protein A994_08326 [Methanobacterium formicicum DSM 3637]
MQKNYKNNSIPDLRRTPQYRDEIDLRYLSMRYLVPMVIMLTVLMISVMMVAATPNSNFPATI